MTYQIRDEHFGLTLSHAETAAEALCRFVAMGAATEARDLVVEHDDGSASIEWGGKTLRAVPAG